MRYRAGDAADAIRVASETLESIDADSGGRDSARWHDLQNRAFTLLRRAYDEVRGPGLYLFRNAKGGDLFPSLTDACRKRPRPAAAS